MNPYKQTMLDLHTNEIFTLFVLITFLLGKLSLAFVNLEQKIDVSFVFF